MFQETQANIYKTDKHVPGNRRALLREADISTEKTEASKEAESAAKDNRMFPWKLKLLCMCLGGPGKCNSGRMGDESSPVRTSPHCLGNTAHIPNGELQRSRYVNGVSYPYFSRSL